MKFNYLMEEEVYSYNKKKNKSYTKNTKTFLSTEQIKEQAETLINLPCNYKTILGYKAKDKEENKIVLIKYNKENEVTVIYTNNKNILKYFIQSYREYNSKIYDCNERYEYIDELQREE